MSILDVDKITKNFGGTRALYNFSVSVKKGEILGIVGPNGSGKTTLFNIITGFYKPDSGKIEFNDQDITGLSPHKICQMGIARTFQIPKPFLNLTVKQNLIVASTHGRKMNFKQANEYACEILELTGLSHQEYTYARDLLLIDLRRLEMARALATKPRLLLLDEVAAGLREYEFQKLLEIIDRIDKMGISIILIEHVMSVTVKCVQRLVVLNKGIKIADGNPYEVINSENVIDIYLGRREF
jgi:branched-chain amino acid transport system ATP-binding protein